MKPIENLVTLVVCSNLAIEAPNPVVTIAQASEWSTIAPLLPGNKGFGHPRTVDLREIINAIFYLQRSGCQWGNAAP
jgi:hypothetical protein